MSKAEYDYMVSHIVKTVHASFASISTSVEMDVRATELINTLLEKLNNCVTLK